ncbi:MAG: hypothetical protein HY329_05645, partial [Chloroflexi bacterium]|nr:hypothetical protein [Chloroflexota bacterium]
MTLLYVAMEDRLLTVRGRDGRWEVETSLDGLPLACAAADPLVPERVYCGTFERGLWRSDDAGATWRSIGDGLPHRFVLAVTVSAQERSGAEGVLWAGTEPSALFRSEDGGSTWQERPALRALPSAPTWSFPPKPWTHHVRSIALHPDDPRHLYVAIELGGVMRSLDGGL